MSPFVSSIRWRNHREDCSFVSMQSLTSALNVRRGKTVFLGNTVSVLEARTLSLPRRREPCSATCRIDCNGKFGPVQFFLVHLGKHGPSNFHGANSQFFVGLALSWMIITGSSCFFEMLFFPSAAFWLEQNGGATATFFWLSACRRRGGAVWFAARPGSAPI